MKKDKLEAGLKIVATGADSRLDEMLAKTAAAGSDIKNKPSLKTEAAGVNTKGSLDNVVANIAAAGVSKKEGLEAITAIIDELVAKTADSGLGTKDALEQLSLKTETAGVNNQDSMDLLAMEVKNTGNHRGTDSTAGLNIIASSVDLTKGVLDTMASNIQAGAESNKLGLGQISSSVENARAALGIVGTNINTGLTSVATNTAGDETKTGLTSVANNMNKASLDLLTVIGDMGEEKKGKTMETVIGDFGEEKKDKTMETVMGHLGEEKKGMMGETKRKGEGEAGEKKLLSKPSLNRLVLTVNSLTASGVKEDMEEKARVQESISLEGGLMASGVTGPGTNQANNNQLGDFVSIMNQPCEEEACTDNNLEQVYSSNPICFWYFDLKH